MKIEISLHQGDSLDDLSDQVSQKVGIKKKNIELVMIKNHEIMEYLTQL
jgi:hypothetical protein